MTFRADPLSIQQGDRLALSRALTAIENDTPESREIMAAIFPFTGKAHLIGITGAPGTGKSTLVNQLARHIRQSAKPNSAPKVAIIAVDPTSPFTGGALLGDRIRMRDLAGDEGIFIRSMASRGALGGLAHNTAAFATLLDGAGFEIILIETVGAGQAEVDIARLAHTVIVVDAPGLGDDIQAIKAGILEIADILVVNKSDQPGAENTARALAVMLEMTHSGGNLPLAGKHMRREVKSTQGNQRHEDESKNWKPPVLQVTAIEGAGIEDVITAINQHRAYLEETGLWQVKEADRIRQDLEALVKDLLMKEWQNKINQDQFDQSLSRVIQRSWTPLDAAESLLQQNAGQN